MVCFRGRFREAYGESRIFPPTFFEDSRWVCLEVTLPAHRSIAELWLAIKQIAAEIYKIVTKLDLDDLNSGRSKSGKKRFGCAIPREMVVMKLNSIGRITGIAKLKQAQK